MQDRTGTEPPSFPYLPTPPFIAVTRETSIEDLLNISYWLWRLNPHVMLPMMLGSAAEVLKQSVIVMALIFGLSQLTSVGLLNKLAEAIQSTDFSTFLSTFLQILSAIMTIVAISIGLFFIISIIVSGFLNSAEYGSYSRLLRVGVLSMQDVFSEMRGRWIKMAWTVFIVETMKNGPILVSLSWVLIDAMGLPSLSALQMIGRLFLWLQVVLISMVPVAILMFLTVYAYPAAIEGNYGLAAIRKSIRTFLTLPANTIAYAILRAGSLFLITFVSYVTSLIGFQLSSIVMILLNLIITPVFHTFKTSLFLKAQSGFTMLPIPLGPPVSKDVFTYVPNAGLERIKKGLHELVDFLSEPRDIVFHIISAMMFSFGITLGKWFSPLGIRQLVYALGLYSGEINPLFKTYGMPFLALDISFHNWQVSMATALSGIVFTFPVFTILLFNGFYIGVIGDVVQNLTMFLAAILPHGIIELPAFIIAGSAGLKLGFGFFKALRRGGLNSNPEFYKVLKKTIYITLGLVPLFIIAGIIEVFITPYVMRFYGWR